MAERKMLLELIKKIMDNRGELSQEEFMNFLVGSGLTTESKDSAEVSKEEFAALKEDVQKILDKQAKMPKYVTPDEMSAFQQDTKKLLKSFVDFFIGYGLELGKESPLADLEELTSKLEKLEGNGGSAKEGGEVKIKWK